MFWASIEDCKDPGLEGEAGSLQDLPARLERAPASSGEIDY
jgi:hypothetical protein